MVRELVGYKIIKGLPDHIEQTVLELIQDGWMLNSEMLPYTTLSGEKIFVQNMVKFEERR